MLYSSNSLMKICLNAESNCIQYNNLMIAQKMNYFINWQFSKLILFGKYKNRGWYMKLKKALKYFRAFINL